LNATNVERARAIIARYPRMRSAMIPLLHVAQEQDGYITPEAMEHVGELVGATAAEVRGVATFYEMFKEEPVGTYLVGVCTNLSCMILGADEVLEHTEKALGIKAGSTTADGMFSAWPRAAGPLASRSTTATSRTSPTSGSTASSTPCATAATPRASRSRPTARSRASPCRRP
jgi:NADH:ubiquinone oxidoreductase subunit E